MKIIVASGNAHKMQEIGDILTDFELVSMKDMGFDGEIDENGSTFKENAYIKAKFIAETYNLPALADDSGLCVDALGGAPGVYSARYSGGGDKANRALLLKNLADAKDRTARFKSAICLYFPDGKTVYGEGACEGKILFEETGANGFGYDCIFYCNDLKKSFGEATAEEKNKVSHRFRALCDLKNKL
ncbi:MAG: RdgB/HAM1 family non-canonical purine NTP pyrophosphatase [Clostridia bacterium]|nr:RdgB/HAM1 family non-canonical purine NTP pyrophosphatase [Clostridia bacterium]